MRTKKLLLVFLLIFVCPGPELLALESYVLKNGLEVFVKEDHIVPLADIRLTFRAGAIVETPELNGLCHLYEHMLFKGNQLYRNQAEFKAALKRMGAGSWNGGTSTEYVTYYITIPSDKLAEGLKFWAYAVKTPLLDEEELVKEREVVHNEIAGKQSQPEYLLRKAFLHSLYPDYWFRRDVGGDLAVIDNATREQMNYIKENFYVPNNAALFVAGDITPGQVMDAVNKYYADWEPGQGFPELRPHKPLPEPKWVAVNNSPSQGLVDVTFTFRGPDTAIDTSSTYAADLWGQMVNDPQGKFKNNVHSAVPELHGGTRYINAGYFTQRDAGSTSFSFTLTVPEKDDLWNIIIRLRSVVMNEIEHMAEKGYFSAEALSSAKQEIENHDILSRETAAGLMANLSFWWASTSTEYYSTYLENIEKTSMDDVRAYVQKYLNRKFFLTSIWINKDDDTQQGIVKMVEQINAGREASR